MVWSRDDTIFSHLFIAAPELFLEEEIVAYLRGRGMISDEALTAIASLRRNRRRVQRIWDRVSGKPLFQRILAIAPEIINVSMVNFLRRFHLISETDAHTLRLMIRAGGVITSGGLPRDRDDILRRARRLLGVGASEEAIQLLRSIDAITVEEANKMRALLIAGGVSVETFQKVKDAKGIVDMLALVGSGLLDARAIHALRLTGLVNARTANALVAALGYGRSLWQVWEGAKRAEGLAARMAFVISGSFSFDALEFLKSTGIVSKEVERYLLPAIKVSQIYNRDLMEQFTLRRYRVVYGEAPIVTYARASKETDAALLRLLAEAAENSRRASLRMAGVRGAQFAIQARQLHVAMRQLWEGVGYLTIFGEHQVADAAIQASEMLQSRLYGRMPEGTRMMLEMAGRAGIDSYISRQENTLQLSRRVYGNMDLWTGKVDKAIKLGLLQGLSAKELADRVAPMINPNVMGGVKYASMRLGRTELANAFHLTHIRHTREMPWVRGYKWNKSSSHRHGDVCDQYAEDDHDGLGPGIFKKANVPGKPHPQCMCYLTTVTDSEAEFTKRMKSGKYNQYLKTLSREPGVHETFAQKAVQGLGKKAGEIAGQVAVTHGMRLVDRMMEGEKHGRLGGNESFNPLRKVQKAGVLAPQVNTNTPSLGNQRARSLVAGRLAARSERGAVDLDAGRLRKRIVDMAEMQAKRASFDEENGEGAFDEYNYRNTLPKFGRYFPDEEFAVSTYGTKAHQAINLNLRIAKGKLKKYDTLFGRGETVFEDLQDSDENDVFDTMMDLEGLIADDEDDVEKMTPLQNYFGQIFYHRWDRDTELPRFSRHADLVKAMDNTMAKTQVDAVNYRITGNNWLGLDHPPTAADVGLVFKDHAYTSTEGVRAYFDNKAPDTLSIAKRTNRVRILVPKGTMATRVNDLENEITLSRGTTFQLLGVTKDSDDSPFDNILDVMVIGQDDLWKSSSKKPKASAESDAFDAIFGGF